MHDWYNTDWTLYGTDCGGELITEQEGYYTTEEIVTNMLRAGQMLEDWRMGLAAEYDDDPDEEIGIEPYEKDPVDLTNSIQQSTLKKAQMKESQTSQEKPQEAPESPVVGQNDTVQEKTPN